MRRLPGQRQQGVCHHCACSGVCAARTPANCQSPWTPNSFRCSQRIQARSQRVCALINRGERLQLVVQDAHGPGQRRGGRAI